MVMTIDDDARKLRFLEWLTTPPTKRAERGLPESQNGMAAELGVSARLLRSWKADPQFRARWEKEAKDIVGDPQKVQFLLQELYEGAMDPAQTLASRVRAAEVFLKATDAIKPPQVDLAAKKAAELSDAELDALLAEAAQRELESRREKAG